MNNHQLRFYFMDEVDPRSIANDNNPDDRSEPLPCQSAISLPVATLPQFNASDFRLIDQAAKAFLGRSTTPQMAESVQF